MLFIKFQLIYFTSFFITFLQQMIIIFTTTKIESIAERLYIGVYMLIMLTKFCDIKINAGQLTRLLEIVDGIYMFLCIYI